jgi:hypothetical protein
MQSRNSFFFRNRSVLSFIRSSSAVPPFPEILYFVVFIAWRMYSAMAWSMGMTSVSGWICLVRQYRADVGAGMFGMRIDSARKAEFVFVLQKTF